MNVNATVLYHEGWVSSSRREPHQVEVRLTEIDSSHDATIHCVILEAWATSGEIDPQYSQRYQMPFSAIEAIRVEDRLDVAQVIRRAIGLYDELSARYGPPQPDDAEPDERAAIAF